MRLESALYSSSEGINAHGQALSVVGDNIANANTVAFKDSRVEFSDLLSNSGGGDQDDVADGIGNGVKVEKVRQIHATGTIEFTGKSLDLAIAGNGFLVAGSEASPTYTRAGNLSVNAEGVLTTRDGVPILGYQGSSATLGEINLTQLDLTSQPTTTATISGNVSSTTETLAAIPATFASFSDLNSIAGYTSSITAYDSLGNPQEVTLAFFKTDTNTWEGQAYVDGAVVGQDAGTPVRVGQGAALAFEPDGQIADAGAGAASLDIAINYANGAAAGAFTVDMASFTQFGGTSIVKSYVQDGSGVGDVRDYEFQSDGSISALLDSGSTVLVGRLPIASFINPEGLDRVGNGFYRASSTSGDPTLGIAGQSGAGEVQGGALELSTVDIAKQFVDLVLYQRGYQANSKVFGTAGDMIRDTLQLMR